MRKQKHKGEVGSCVFWAKLALKSRTRVKEVRNYCETSKESDQRQYATPKCDWMQLCQRPMLEDVLRLPPWSEEMRPYHLLLHWLQERSLNGSNQSAARPSHRTDASQTHKEPDLHMYQEQLSTELLQLPQSREAMRPKHLQVFRLPELARVKFRKEKPLVT